MESKAASQIQFVTLTLEYEGQVCTLSPSHHNLSRDQSMGEMGSSLASRERGLGRDTCRGTVIDSCLNPLRPSIGKRKGEIEPGPPSVGSPSRVESASWSEVEAFFQAPSDHHLEKFRGP